jgi:hypothetical protein
LGDQGLNFLQQGEVGGKWKGKASGSFLKKRTKKFLLWGCLDHRAD